MKYFTLQIHITGECNCRCKHCYIKENANYLPINVIKSIFDQYLSLIAVLQQTQNEQIHPLLNITGGEPFLYPDIDGLFKLFNNYKNVFTFRFATNGTLLTERHVALLKDLNIQFVQLSIDGDEKTHDEIRGKGNYQKVTRALELLRNNEIKSRISFTANAYNYQSIPDVVSICRNYGVFTFWSDRYVPCNISDFIKELNPTQTKEYVTLLDQERANSLNSLCHLSVQNYRSLQFLSNNSFPYHCTAGQSSIAIDENGTIYPCRRLFVDCGNIYKDRLADVFFNHTVFMELRNQQIPPECMACEYAEFCRGGARCQCFAKYGDLKHKDPGCWL